MRGSLKITFRTLFMTYLRPQWRRVTLMTLLLLSSIALQLINPQILGYFVNTFTAGGSQTALTLAGGAFIAIALANQGIAVLATYYSENVAWTATNQLRIDLVTHCLGLDMVFHKAHTAGELIERIDGDVNTLSRFFSQAIIYLLGNTLLIVGVLVLLFLADWRIGLTMLIFASIALLILTRISTIAVPFWEQNRQQFAETMGFLGEQLAGTEDVRANGATGYVMTRYYQIMRRSLPISRRASLAGYSMWMSILGVFAVGNALAFALGAALWSSHAISIGTVYLIFYYTNLIMQPMEQIRTQLQELQQAGAGIERIQRLFAIEPAIRDGRGTPLPAGALDVDFAHVTFGYHADALVLNNITFTLPAGQVLGIVGRTGSGKTTLARLLLRLYDIQMGEIRLGNIPVQDMHLRTLRQHIGMVTQDVQLFHASVRDNLTFFNRAIPDERILQAIDDLGMTPWLKSLSAGLDTELGSDGEGLSAGEAQLLAFTRVFLANPGLIILDEASSRLDPATEQLIEQAVSKLLAGRTGIIIAHRLATLQRVDAVLALQDGRMLEYGPRAALVNDPTSHFYSLLQTGREEILA